ncbi:MAG: cytidylate kinase-like family protein [Lachnospiraceae bacterium]|nr:cytidylate kinase-like family protein [Lachnospiraceae bacterium]
MSKQYIVAIGREYGSGGHEIGRQLSEKLGVKLFDRNLLDNMFENEAQREEAAKYEESGHKMFLSRRVKGFSNSIEENLALMQFDYMKEQAETGESFVIVGRCAESVLRKYDGLISIFVMGDLYEKIKRIEDVYKVGEKEAIEKITRHDRTRAKYHNAYADTKWGDARGYDLCINSSKLGIRGTVDVLYDYIEARRKGSEE